MINPKKSGNQWDSASYFSKWTFSVANQMLNKGFNSPLQKEDLMQLSKHDLTAKLTNKLKKSLITTKKNWFVPKILIALCRSFPYDLTVIFIYTILEGAVRIASPIILYDLIYGLKSTNKGESFFNIYISAGILGFLGLLQTFIHHVLFFYSMRIGWNWKSSVSSLVFQSLFNLHARSISIIGTGKLVNLISNDVSRYEEFTVFMMFFIVSLMETLTIMILLIYQLNVASAFAAVGLTTILIPVQIYLAKQFAAVRSSTASATDQRVRHISEVIDGIASVKSYSWEVPFFKLIDKFRATEELNISRSQTLKAFNFALYYCVPPVASFATFSVYKSTGGQLTLPTVYCTVSLLLVLRTSIGRHWTRSIETGSEALSASKRIENFMSSIESDKTLDTHESEKIDDGDDDDEANKTQNIRLEILNSKIDSHSLLHIENMAFSYSENDEQLDSNIAPTISDISLSVKPGELVMIIGPVGSGKSTLLASILGETNVCRSREQDTRAGIFHQGDSIKIAYCPQKPWILASTVKSNIILAGSKFSDDSNENIIDYKNPTFIDLNMYSRAVECCKLVKDMINWPWYDETEIGERGVSISGGQKARIALARAVYSDADLFLLDDPLSACDSEVGSKLFHECIIGNLRGKDKGIVLCTHQLQYLNYSDKIVVLNREGKQQFYGTYDEFNNQRHLFDFFDFNNIDITVSCGTMLKSNSYSRLNTTGDIQVLETSYSIETSLNSRKKRIDNESNFSISSDKDSGEGKIVSIESKMVGKLSFNVWIEYITAGGISQGIFVILIAILAQVLIMISDYWLRWWATESFGQQNDSKYIWIYAILISCCIFLGFYRASAWFKFTLSASSGFYRDCLWAIVRCPLSFFIANPKGRILNRFAKDQSVIDENLPVTLFDFIQCALFCISSIILLCICIPWLSLMLPPLLWHFLLSREKYLRSSREIKRIEAISRSPIYAEFSSTLEGLSSIKAYKLENRVISTFNNLVDENGRAWFSFLMVSRWLGFRLDLECALILIIASISSVAVREYSEIDVGLLGFALVYILGLSGLFQWTVRQSAEVETQMTSVERILEYTRLSPEMGYKNPNLYQEFSEAVHENSSSGKKKYSSVPSKENTRGITALDCIDEDTNTNNIEKNGKGKVDIVNLHAKYRDDLDPVLKGLNLTIPAGSKVGICGRTGCGKSTFLLAILRLNIVSEGNILVDGESLLDMGLERARSLISVIPQEPHLFSGTIRFNLDPFNVYSDDAIWESLKDSHIIDHIRKDPLGLMSRVEEGGKNFSVGQRQLLSLARAILRNSPVVLCDEVTASIDYQTDKLIQETIRTSPSLKNSTIITIAHRLRTIADSDMIIVMHNGVLVEEGSPYELLEYSSQFKSLVEESNEFDEIYEIARKSYKFKS